MEAEVGEVEEEELVDFEGSDYSIGFDDEYGDEEESRGPSTSSRAEDILLEQVQQSKLFETHIIHPNCPREAICYPAETLKVEARDNQFKCPNSQHSDSQGGAESGEIKEEKDKREEGAISKLVFGFDKNLGNNIRQGKAGKHFKADLEDGELDDAAMPEASNDEAEGNMEVFKSNEAIGQERKRKNFDFVADWQTDERERETKEAPLTPMVSRQNHPRGRQSDRSGILSKGRPSGRGSNMHIFGLAHANTLPCIGDPRRPLMPGGLGGQISLQHIGGPMGIATHIQFQERLPQEQMLRSQHAMQLSVPGLGHPPFNMDAPPTHPFFGLDYFGPGPRGMMHLQPPHRCNILPPINFIGAIDNSGRGHRPIFGAERGRSSCVNIGGRAGSIPSNGYGRSSTWPLNPVDMPAVGRGRVRARQMPFPIGADLSKFSHGNQCRVDQTLGFRQQEVVPGADGSKVDKFEQAQSAKWNLMERENLPFLNALHDDRDCNSVRQGFESKKIQKIGPLAESHGCEINCGGSKLSKGKIVGGGKSSLSGVLQDSSSSSREAGSATPNLIQLGGPVQRSRVLAVGGLPEDTPLSTVIEAFEKQGKIMDLKKEAKGNVFTLTFSTLLEAVSAKRLLHRSFLAGSQITVEYSL